MAKEKLNTGPVGQPGLGDTAPDIPGNPTPEAGDVEVSAEQIKALMAEKKAAERATLGDEGAALSGEPDLREPWEKTSAELEAENPKPRRGRRPKAELEAPGDGEPGTAGKAEKGRAPKKGKEVPEKPKAPKKEKTPRAPKDKGDGGGPSTAGPATAEPPAPAPEPRDASRGVEEKIVYLNLSELHEFPHHPFGVRDDLEMQSLVESVKDKGVHQPALVCPREDGGYEIIAGHRRQKASELAGFANMPCIVRNMTDDEAMPKITSVQKV